MNMEQRNSRNVLEVVGLQTHFQKGDQIAKAVDDISFEVVRGSIVGLVGESGSGKSVTGLSLMGLIDQPGKVVGGKILLNGIDLRTLSEKEMRQFRGNRISMIFQDPMMTLNPVLRIETQMVEAVLAHHPTVSSAAARDRARDMLGRMGIPSPDERLRAYPFQLSGGMCQRVAIATALLNEPDLIIADEPTTALDVTIQSQILAEAQAMCRTTRTSMIWITHDLSVVASLADEVCVMYAGRIIERGPVEQVLWSPSHPYTRGLLDSMPEDVPVGSRLNPIAGSTPSLFALPSGCSFHPRCNRNDHSGCVARFPEVRRKTPSREVRCHHPLVEMSQ